MVELIVAPDARSLETHQATMREYAALSPLEYPATYQEVWSLALHICEQDGTTLGVAVRQAAQELSFVLDLPPPGNWLHVEDVYTTQGGRYATSDNLPW